MRGLGRLKLTSVALVDYIAAQRLKNTLLINGFWRSGTTWLQQTLVEALHAKSLFEPFSPAAGHQWDGWDYEYDRDQDIYENFDGGEEEEEQEVGKVKKKAF